MLRPTRLLHFDHPDGPSLAKLARSRTQPAQHSHSGPGLVRPVHAPTRGPRPYGPGPLQTQRALLPCCHSRPGARLSKSLPACSLHALGSLALHLSQPFCTLLLGFIGLALSRPGYHPRAAEPPATPANGGVGGSSTPEARARRKKGDSGNGSATPLMRNDTTSAPVDGGPCGQSNSGHRPPCSPFPLRADCTPCPLRAS